MDFLRSYCAMLVAASVLGGLCAALASRPFSGYLRYLTALICIVLIVAPFRSLDLAGILSAQGSATEEAEQSGEAPPETENRVEKTADAMLEAWFLDALFSETGIKAEAVRIEMDRSEKDPVITGLCFLLPGGGKEEEDRVLRWAETKFGVPCEVLTR